MCLSPLLKHVIYCSIRLINHNLKDEIIKNLKTAKTKHYTKHRALLSFKLCAIARHTLMKLTQLTTTSNHQQILLSLSWKYTRNLTPHYINWDPSGPNHHLYLDYPSNWLKSIITALSSQTFSLFCSQYNCDSDHSKLEKQIISSPSSQKFWIVCHLAQSKSHLYNSLESFVWSCPPPIVPMISSLILFLPSSFSQLL